MDAPTKLFKAALARGERQLGLWLALADSYAAEICAGSGFDWLLIDAEHAPNDIRSILQQLRALASCPAHAVVRPPVGETWPIKHYLDVGAQTLLVPLVEGAEQARALVEAARYPPHGVRGAGSAVARASRRLSPWRVNTPSSALPSSSSLRTSECCSRRRCAAALVPRRTACSRRCPHSAVY